MIKKNNRNDMGYTLVAILAVISAMVVILILVSLLITSISDSANKTIEKANQQKDKETSLIETDNEVRFRK